MNLTAFFRSAPSNAPVFYPGTETIMEAGDWVVQGKGADADFGKIAADGSVHWEIGGVSQDLYDAEDSDTEVWTTSERAQSDCMARRTQD